MVSLPYTSTVRDLVLTCQADPNRAYAMGLLASIQVMELTHLFHLTVDEALLQPFLGTALASSFWPLLASGQIAAVDRSIGLDVNVDELLPTMPPVNGNPTFTVYFTPVLLSRITPAVLLKGHRAVRAMSVTGSNVAAQVSARARRYVEMLQHMAPGVPLPTIPRIALQHPAVYTANARSWLKSKL